MIMNDKFFLDSRMNRSFVKGRELDVKKEHDVVACRIIEAVDHGPINHVFFLITRL
jgi:hypothetical protein